MFFIAQQRTDNGIQLQLQTTEGALVYKINEYLRNII